MLQITSLPISATTQTHLNSQQNDINNQASYEGEVNRAASLWKSKESSNRKKVVFKELKEKLQNMAPGQHYCCYCEQNEHSDIEHIYPKSVFPNKAFVWDNYIWACKSCNTAYKSDTFSIFNPLGSNIAIDITPTYPNRVYARPMNHDSTLINPKVDDPFDFLCLDLETGILISNPFNSPRFHIRADYTLDLLKLNKREAILIPRKNAAKEYLSTLKRYIKAKSATNFTELELSMEELAPVTFTLSFDQEKSKTCLAIQKSIYTRTHFTVWKELQRQANLYPSLTALFQQAPEALNW